MAKGDVAGDCEFTVITADSSTTTKQPLDGAIRGAASASVLIHATIIGEVFPGLRGKCTPNRGKHLTGTPYCPIRVRTSALCWPGAGAALLIAQGEARNW